jgi:DNA-binding NtrC family response regulator
VLLADGAVLRIGPSAGSGDPGADVRSGGLLTARGFREAKARAIAAFEKAYLAELLARTRGNLSLAARLSGKERSRLGKLVKKHGLARARFSGEAESA